MSEETVVEATEDAKPRKPRAKKAVEEVAPEVIENVAVVEAEETVADADQTVITGPKRSRAPRNSNMHTKVDGVVGSHAADSALRNAPKASAKAPAKEQDLEKVAVWSSKNIRWTGVGELSKGYNIVTKEAAEKWLSKAGIREATPEEVATYYSK